MSLPTKCPPLGATVRAKIERVIDGDTVVVTVRDITAAVRLLDCWAPERGTEAGKAAREAMEAIASPGTPCRVSIPTGDANDLGDILTFGRVLGQIWLASDLDMSLGAHMVALGHATREKQG